MGYAYDDELGKQAILCHNPAGGIHVLEFGKKLRTEFAVGFKKIN